MPVKRGKSGRDGGEWWSVARRCVSAALITVGLAGCTTAQQGEADVERASPVVYELDSTRYARVFDSAIALSVDEGMPTAVIDRDGGIIESRPRISGSLIEPWNWPAGFEGALDDTASFHRRVIRFEFIPAGFHPRPPEEDRVLLGHRVPGLPHPEGDRGIDLGGYEGPIELRVWVFIERAFTPHLQRSTWTFSQRSFAYDPLDRRPPGDGTTRSRSIWTPVNRDPVMEQALLVKLRERLEG